MTGLHCSSSDENTRGFSVRSLDDASWEALGRDVLNNDENISAVNNAVTLIADSIASLRPQLMRVESGGKRVLIADHPVQKILKRPCSWLNWSEFTSFVMRSVLLYGNAYAVIEGQELIPLNGRSVSCYLGGSNIVYEASYPFGKQSQRLTSDQIIHFKTGALDNFGVCGLSPLDRSPSVRELASTMQEAVLMGFEQGVYPSLVLQIDDLQLSDDESERLQSRLSAKFNAKRAFQKPLVLGQKVTAKDVKPNSNREAQLIEARKFLVSEVARVFNINETLLSSLDKATLSNVREYMVMLHTHTLKPHIVRFQQAFSNALLEDDVELVLDQSEYTDGDINTRRESISKLVKEQVLTAEEAKQLLGLS